MDPGDHDALDPPAWHHEALLRAGLARGEAAIAAFHAWRARVDLDDVDGESVALLPAVYRNLVAHGVDDPLLPRLRGVYRKAWTQGQLRAASVLAALDALRERAIPALLARGAPLAARHLGDAGICAPADADVVVASAAMPAALEALRSAGWTPGDGSPRTETTALRLADGTGLTLHAGLPGGPGRLAGIAVEPLDGTPATALDAAGQLLFVCGRRGAGQAWAVEAMAVLRARPVDWPGLVRLADAAGAAALLAARLDLLARLLDAPVPGGVVETLRDRARRAAARGRTLRGAWRSLTGEFRAWARRAGARPTPPTFLRYLRTRWGLTSSLALPRAAWLRLGRILRGPAR